MSVIFRTEADHKQGMGDLWGSIALADQMHSRDKKLFVLSNAAWANPILRARGYTVTEVKSVMQERKLLEKLKPDAVVVNKLKNSPAYIRMIKKSGTRVMTIDDDGPGARWADVRLNVLYPVARSVNSPRFMYLRRDFVRMHAKRKEIFPVAKRLLVTQGGGDTYGFTPKILNGLKPVAGLFDTTVVLGPAFKHHLPLKKALKGFAGKITVLRSTNKMAELMYRADLAITAGGLTMFELACVGTPSLVVCAEPFEVATAARLQKQGIVRNLGFGKSIDYNRFAANVWELAENFELRKKMSVRGKALIDGRGPERVMRLIREMI